MKTLKNLREKMSIRLNEGLFNIICMLIKLGICMYTTYANCQTLGKCKLLRKKCEYERGVRGMSVPLTAEGMQGV